jgi:formyltetrahydrofolate-dependent phosphoribosylglycinamide formyltransferase
VSARLRIAVLVSGGGRSLENLIERSRDGRLAADVALVVASNDTAFALERARRHGIPTAVLRRRDFADAPAFGRALAAALDAARVDLAVLAGYLVKVPVAPAWRGRMINIHPALLPAFGGKGYHGEHVHEAVLRSGASTSGCTVHFVDDEYDHGPIILQRSVPVLAGDTAETLAARVFEAEKEALPEAIHRYASGREGT